jgi:predicted dehydrogenase
MLLQFGKAGWAQKARMQPDKVRLVLDKIRTDGLLPTVETVLSRLDQPLPLGYCNVGRVVAIGESVRGFSVGDRVLSNGRHAEVVSVPAQLCARIPDAVSDDEASFGVLGAIALQGIRLANPTLGESVAVIGLGLIGILAVKLLKANGCRVIAFDIDRGKLAIARACGAEACDLSSPTDAVAAAAAFSRGIGIDAVLLTASTSSEEPVHLAAQMSRKRGRIVLVGVTGMQLSRADFYEKELTFQVSCSYGPGRYDPAYEDKGQDYPVGFVRWTEQRNFVAVLDMMAEARLSATTLISHRFSIDEAQQAYELLTGQTPTMGIMIDYPAGANADSHILLDTTVAAHQTASRFVRRHPSAARPRVAVIGAGNYAMNVLIPAIRRTAAVLDTVVSLGGASGSHAGGKYGFERVSSDYRETIRSDRIDAVVIATRHDTHAVMVCEALAAGKHVFVEKPLAVTDIQIDLVADAYSQGRPENVIGPIVMVGFNRRFAPHVVKAKELLAGLTQPKAFVMTVNAGAIPASHWTQDGDIGGGRIVGEGCHFIDLLRFLAGAPIVGHAVVGMDSPTHDTATVSLLFGDGSIGTVHYLANGHRSVPKERLEIFACGKILRLDNFRRLEGFGWATRASSRAWRQDKGQAACMKAFVAAVSDGTASPIAFEELIEVARVSVRVDRELSGR